MMMMMASVFGGHHIFAQHLHAPALPIADNSLNNDIPYNRCFVRHGQSTWNRDNRFIGDGLVSLCHGMAWHVVCYVMMTVPDMPLATNAPDSQLYQHYLYRHFLDRRWEIA